MPAEAQVHWTKELQFVARSGTGPALVIDSQDGRSGPTPMELILIGVAGCTAMDVVSIMRKKRAHLTDFRVNVTGERAEDHPKRYTKIRIEYVLYGKEIKPRDVEKAIHLSATKYCSAMASLNAAFEQTYSIVETDG